MATPKKRKTAAPKKRVIKRATTTGTKKQSLKKTVAQTPDPDTLDQIIAKAKIQYKINKLHLLEIPWEAKMVATNLGAKWHKGLKHFAYEGERLPEALQPYKSSPHSLAAWLEHEVQPHRHPLIKNGAPTMKPRPHQETAIKKVYDSATNGWTGFVIADDVGIGKTLEALIAASKVAAKKGYTNSNPAKLLIMGPKNSLKHWKNTFAASGVQNLRPLIINYEQSKKILNEPTEAALASRTRTKNSRHSSYGTTAIKWDIIISDESQKLKNDSQRSKAFANIAEYSNRTPTKPFIIWLSATIGQTPLDLHYLAPLLSQMLNKPITSKNWPDWLINNKFNITKSTSGSYYWIRATSPEEEQEVSQKQSKDIERLAKLIFNPAAPSIRRKPEEIRGWPKQTNNPIPIQLDPTDYKLYDTAWKEFRQRIQLEPRGKNPVGALAITQRFQQKASLIKTDYTADFADNLIENGNQAIISVKYIESLVQIKELLEKKGHKVSEYSGRNEHEREDERLRFQKGETQAIVFTTEDAVSFHAGEQLADGTNATNTPRKTIVHDIRYSAIGMTQILGRGTRDGQLSHAFYMYAEDTVEPHILKLMLNKLKNMSILQAEKETTVQEVYALLDSI